MKKILIIISSLLFWSIPLGLSLFLDVYFSEGDEVNFVFLIYALFLLSAAALSIPVIKKLSAKIDVSYRFFSISVIISSVLIGIVSYFFVESADIEALFSDNDGFLVGIGLFLAWIMHCFGAALLAIVQIVYAIIAWIKKIKRRKNNDFI